MHLVMKEDYVVMKEDANSQSDLHERSSTLQMLQVGLPHLHACCHLVRVKAYEHLHSRWLAIQPFWPCARQYCLVRMA